MKHAVFLFLLLVTSSSIAQSDKFSLGVLSGYDFYSKSTHGWNVSACGQFKFNEGSKWYHEYGISYSEREYNLSGDVVLDTSETSYYQMLSFGNQSAEEYRKENFLRFQGGLGRTVLENERQKLSVGMNLGISWKMRKKGHGQYVNLHYTFTDTTSTVSYSRILAYSYNSTKPELNSLLEFLPYINYNVKINDVLSFNTRLTGLYPLIQDWLRKPQAQLNVGLYYSF